MWKSKKFIVVAALVAVVLVGSTGVVLAQDGNKGVGSRQALLARVAQILGTTQQKLEDAFKTAMTEQRDVNMDNRLKKLVTDGKITQKQADAYKAWLKARPAGVPMIGGGLMIEKGLDKLVQEGKITQQQLDAFKGWLKAKPDLQLPKPDKPNGQRLPARPGPGKAPK
jgi:hypothetical protein